MAANPLFGFTLDRSQIVHADHDLQRAECILANRDGTLGSADTSGGATRRLHERLGGQPIGKVSFEGADLKTVYLASLMGRTISSWRSPLAGLPMVHWTESR